MSAFGLNELSARFVPLAGSVVALAVFAQLARAVLSRWAALAALAMMAAAAPLVLHASQAKPYSTDVLATCLVLEHAARALSLRTTRAQVRLGAVGAAVVWVSTPALLVVAGVYAALAIEHFRASRKGQRRSFVVVAVATGLVCATSLALTRHRLTASTAEYLNRFWAGGFPPPASLRGRGGGGRTRRRSTSLAGARRR